MPVFDLKLKGDYKELKLQAHLDDGKVLYNKFIIEPKTIDINSSYSLQKGDLTADITADINSNIAHAAVDLKADLNTNDINNTLNFKTLAKIIAPKRKKNDFNLTVTKKTVITLDAKGDSKNIQALLNANGEFIYDGIKIKPHIKDTKALFNIKSQDLKAELNADIISSIAKVKTDAKLSLNTKDIGDFNRFDVSLDTKKIDIGKIYRYLPKDMQKSFVNLKSKGYYKLSSNEAKFSSKLRGLKYADKIIKCLCRYKT